MTPFAIHDPKRGFFRGRRVQIRTAMHGDYDARIILVISGRWVGASGYDKEKGEKRRSMATVSIDRTTLVP